MPRYVVMGSGRQGLAAAWDLIESGAEVRLADADTKNLSKALAFLGLPDSAGSVVNFRNRDEVLPSLEWADGAVFAADYSLNLDLTKWAIEAACNTVDYGGNHDVVHAQHELNEQAKSAGVAIVPDTGLTPGLAGVLVAGGVKKLDQASAAYIRVGGLPQDPQPPLNYALIFSVRGLTNEYLEPSVIVTGGEKTTRPSLTGLEKLSFGDREFEAFYTSGGVSTLPETFADVLDELDCKTIRYPGHVELIRFAFDIGFRSEKVIEAEGRRYVPREVFEEMLVESLPHDPPDETLMRVTVRGNKGGKPSEVVYEMVDLYDTQKQFTSMQRTTAWPGSLILRMVTEGEIPERGVLYQERVVNADLLVERLAERGVRIDCSVRPVK
ncbi:MAG: saccharopine dehydrogenase C-terminal domain-containing protein [bacterium]